MLPEVDAVAEEDAKILSSPVFDIWFDTVDDEEGASCPTYDRVDVEKYSVRNNGKTKVSKSDRTTNDSANLGDDCSNVYNDNAPTSVCNVRPYETNKDSKFIFRADDVDVVIDVGPFGMSVKNR